MAPAPDPAGEVMEDVQFSLTVKRLTWDVCLMWRGGKLHCDDERVIQLVERVARTSSHPPIWAPQPADPDAGPLADPHWAYNIMRMIMGPKAVMRGKLPPIPGPPPGAIN